jgi:hypothetical protein
MLHNQAYILTSKAEGQVFHCAFLKIKYVLVSEKGGVHYQ